MIDEAILNAQSSPGVQPWIRITISSEGFSIDVTCADEEENHLYALASEHYWRPHKLAVEMERHSEDLSERILAACYAHGGIIVGSPTPELEHYTPDEWEAWLLQDRERFRIIRSYCEAKTNFVADRGAPSAHRTSGADAGSDLAQSNEDDRGDDSKHYG